jgi:hypothetical protein
MSDDQVIKLLEEIRDLQKQHVENYQDALKNQREAMEMQVRAMRRHRITSIVLGLLLIGAVIFLAVWGR